jgi:hypothetical protein
MSQVKIYLPPPSDWQAFQDLVVQVAKKRYVPESVQDYGRQGQKQHGVDIYAEGGDGSKIGIQCKETKAHIDKKIIETDAKDAKGFSQKLDLFIIATTERRDKRLQDVVMGLNSSGEYPFKLRIEFWDDFQQDINQSAMVLNACYEDYKTAFHETDQSHHLECLGSAFNRPAFRDSFAHERNYGHFGEALAETLRLFSLGIVRDRDSSIGVIQTVPLRSLPDGKYKNSVKKIDNMLSKMYHTFISEAQKLSHDQRYANDRAGHYNIERRKLMDYLNKMLTDARLQPIVYRY